MIENVTRNFYPLLALCQFVFSPLSSTTIDVVDDDGENTIWHNANKG